MQSNKDNRSLKVIFLGRSGFPFGFAEAQKQRQIARALSMSGAACTIICNRGILTKAQAGQIRFQGSIDGVSYIYSSIGKTRNRNYLLRNFNRLVGKVIELFLLLIHAFSGKKKVAVISSQRLNSVRYYYTVLKMLNYKVAVVYDEFMQTHPGAKGKTKEQFDKKLGYYCDAIFPISSFLSLYQKAINPRMPQFQVPALTDFRDFPEVTKIRGSSFSLLFCGAAGYSETIKLVISAFEKTRAPGLGLTLIINGTPSEMQAIHVLVSSSPQAKQISVLSDLPFDQLIRQYQSATLLLIPLAETTRDKARFPQKISEYAASRTPMVTTASGDVPKYFKDQESAFIAQEYSPESFASKINEALADERLRQKVGQNAYEIGLRFFNTQTIGPALIKFLEELFDAVESEK